jgi:hypothetical protein
LNADPPDLVVLKPQEANNGNNYITRLEYSGR